MIPKGTPVKFALLLFFEKFNWAGKGSPVKWSTNLTGQARIQGFE